MRQKWAAYAGPASIVIDCNDAFREALGFDPVGIPARELWSGYDGAFAVMDRVYQTGVAAALGGDYYCVLIVPLCDEQGVWGLTTLWTALVRSPRPEPPTQVPPVFYQAA